jgi:hypothetical protein
MFALRPELLLAAAPFPETTLLKHGDHESIMGSSSI